MKRQHFAQSVIGVLLVAVLLLGGCGGGTGSNTPDASGDTAVSSGNTETAEPGGSSGERVLTFAISSDWGSLNPYDSTNSMYSYYLTIDKIYDKLIYADESGTAQPRAAKSWTLADDGMSLTFELDENAKWHDGEPVTAEDWVWTINYMTSAYTTQHGFGKYLAGVDAETGVKTGEEPVGAEAVGDYELKLTFNAPVEDANSFLVSHSTTTAVLPKHLLEGYTDETVTTADYFNMPVGSGPVIVESIEMGNNIVTSANKDYQLGVEGFDKLIIQVTSADTWLAKIAAGDVDVVQSSISPAQIMGYENDPGISYRNSGSISNGLNMVMNCTLVPKAIRQAIDRGLDKQWIVDSVYLGQGQPSYSLILPSYPYYDSSVGGRDLDGAKALVEQAIADGVWSADRVLNIYYNGAVSEAVAKTVQSDLLEIGIQSEVISGDINTINSYMFNNTEGYDALIVNLGVSPATPMKSMVTYLEQYESYSHSHVFLAEQKPGYEADYNTFLQLFGMFSQGIDLENTTRAYQEWEYENVPQSELATYYSIEASSARSSGIDTFASAYYNMATWNWTIE